MYKNIFIAIMILFISLPSLAQHKAAFGIHGEFYFSGIDGDLKNFFGTEEFKMNNYSGIKITLFSEINIHKSLFLEPRISYVEKGFKANYKVYKEEFIPNYKVITNGNSDIELNANYFQFPLLIKYKYKFAAMAGGFYYARLNDARVEEIFSGKTQYIDRYFNTFYYIHERTYNSTTELENFKKEEYGFMTGIEFEFPFGVSITAYYDRGLTTVFSSAVTSSKIINESWLLGTKYKFIKNKPTSN